MEKQIPWNTGSGNIILTYQGQDNGTITVDTDDNNLFSQRSQNLSVKGGDITRTVTVSQNAAQYKLIEWVENTTSNVLNFTGIIPNDNNWEFYGKVQPIYSGSYETIIRAYTGEAYNCYRIIRNSTSNTNVLVNANSKAGGGSTNIQNTVSTSKPFEFNLKYGSVTIDDTTFTLSTTQGTTLTTALQINRGRWYGLTIYHNGMMIKCYHPCIDSQGKYGLVDVLTDTIVYPTKGTFDNGSGAVSLNFKDVDRKRILTKDGRFFNVSEES